MTLLNHKCDSCSKIVDVLFPIAMLDEIPSGGEAMVMKYYCVECKDTIEAEAEDVEPDETDDEEEEDVTRDYPCGCVYDRLIQQYLWREIITCVIHVVQGDERVYECGCKVELIEKDGRVWQFTEECNFHKLEEEK